MRIKKGFTLAEILIVLMVIGVIAAMTIPSLMKGVMEAQYKSAYKKAHNYIVNISSMEKVSGQMPQKRNAAAATLFYGVMDSALNVKEYIYENEIDSGIVVKPGESVAGLNIASGTTNFHIGSESSTKDGLAPSNGRLSSWLIADDGISYAMMLTGADSDNDCERKADIVSKGSAQEAADASCMLLVVDVNGLYKGPNRLERQSTVAGELTNPADTVGSNLKMTTLTRDRYYIYVGSDGATAGPPATTVSGRIINDLK